MKDTTRCRDMEELLELHASGLLECPETASQRDRLSAHLACCEACSAAWERERQISESMAALSRLRVSVSVEERVMAAVRTEAARRPSPASLSCRQKATLGGAALLGTLAELAAAAAIITFGWEILGWAATRDTAAAYGRYLGWIATLAVEIGLVLSRTGLVLLRALSPLVPSPQALAAGFLTLVVLMTFVAVRRDLHRSPAAARGLR